MADLPSFDNYGNYSSDNYGAHSLHFTDAARNEYWFSYSTLIAFRGPSGQRYVRQNDWRTTTGKHLNWIDGGDKKSRLNGKAFDEAFQREFGRSIEKAA